MQVGKTYLLWLAEFLLPLQGQQQLMLVCYLNCIVVISWIFTTFTGSTTTPLNRGNKREKLWLAEFLLPLQGQQQQVSRVVLPIIVVISWIFTTFTGSTTTAWATRPKGLRLWLAEFLLPLQGQQQHNNKYCMLWVVVISWIFTTFTGSTTTYVFSLICLIGLWLAEFLLPLQGQQQLQRYTHIFN